MTMDGRLLDAATTGDAIADDGKATTSSPGGQMDWRLMEAAITGDAVSMKHLASHDPDILLGTTPQGNTCLHIASIHGHKEFCNDAMTFNLSLLSAVNADEETPLLTAVKRGHVSLASFLLTHCLDQQLSRAILKKDKQGCNALHHALRSDHRELALELIAAEPTLSQAVNNNNESPMFIAVMKDFTDLFEKLLDTASSAHSGAYGSNALHAAVGNGNSAIAKRLMEKRPLLAREENENKYTPILLAANEGKVDVLTVLLEHDPSLGYLISSNGATVLCGAACGGHVGVARALLRHCPDAPYTDPAGGSTCLHVAVLWDKKKFVKFVVGSQQLRHLINMTDNNRETALQLAVRCGRSEIVTVLDNANHANPFISVAGASAMDVGLLEASTTGDAIKMQQLATDYPGVLLGTTPQGNTCLHIASVHGHEVFCKAALALEPSLLAAINADGETPLLSAVTSGRVSLASFLLVCCRDQKLDEAILKQDKNGFNALHNAIRSGHRKLALELIAAEPALSRAVTKHGESPMYMAVMRNYPDVFKKVLEIPDSAHVGAHGSNALHAAVRNAIAKKIMETRPGLAREENDSKNTPMQLAALWDKIDVLRVLLEHDRSLGYVVSSHDDTPVIASAAYRGHVGVARELLKHCPDAPYCGKDGWTCLHVAVWNEQTEFVEFVLGSPQLRGLVNKQHSNGNTALHMAVQKCNPKMVASLLLHQDTDVTVLSNNGAAATWTLYGATDHAKTLNWNEVSMLMLKADPQEAASIYNLHKEAKDKVTNLSRKDIKSLTQTYTGNTSLVAILLAAITFAAAFTLPGGYSSDAGSQGLPIMVRKVAFQAFIISDTLAMCASLAVAFICIIAKWEDLEFLLYYRSFTKKLMWFAYVATTTAFATGLYTVLAPRLLWLSVTVCVLTGLLPILTKVLGEWPILKLRFRLGLKFKSELLDMV
ncbi:ankyrin-3 isoform X2 [Setaria italica]|uniref:ankyrin-3 isoform X2 n=1 Tax=Setaria italica TaxID=4555 RepID=UPI000350AA71|nr:ankyrin-3 isoform X2 [Setaria italica]